VEGVKGPESGDEGLDVPEEGGEMRERGEGMGPFEKSVVVVRGMRLSLRSETWAWGNRVCVNSIGTKLGLNCPVTIAGGTYD